MSPVVAGQETAPYVKRMIKCPGHYLIPPTVDIYLREPVPLLRDCKEVVDYRGQPMRIRKERIARDRWGNKIIDWKKVFQLERLGIVKWPLISAAEAIERIYDPQGRLCQLCRQKPCREGQGTIVETSIRRLMGKPELR